MALSSEPKAQRAESTGMPRRHPQSQHVVMITQENSSFDSYFGTYPGANQEPEWAGEKDVVFWGRIRAAGGSPQGRGRGASLPASRGWGRVPECEFIKTKPKMASLFGETSCDWSESPGYTRVGDGPVLLAQRVLATDDAGGVQCADRCSYLL